MKQFTPKELETIVSLTREHYSVEYVAKHLKCDQRRIRRFLNEIELRASVYERRMIKQYERVKWLFEDTPIAHYFLGLLGADGHVTKEGSIELSLIDKKPVATFATLCDTKFEKREIPPIEIHSGKMSIPRPQYRVRIQSKKAIDSLYTAGLYLEHKTFNYIVPEIYSKSPDFWRGMIDGDGCITKPNKLSYKVTIIGTASMCESFVSFVGSGCVRKVPGAYSVRCYLRKDLIDYIWYDNCFGLDRKNPNKTH